MGFGNALTGFMQGLDPNRDLLKRMRQWDIERELRQQTRPMQTAGGKTYASTARPQDGTYGYWVSDAAPQQQQMLDEQERAFQPEGGLRRYRNYNNRGHETFYNTEAEANAAASQYNSVPEQLNRAAAVYAKYGDVDKSSAYALKARGLQREDAAYDRAEASRIAKEKYIADRDAMLKQAVAEKRDLTDPEFLREYGQFQLANQEHSGVDPYKYNKALQEINGLITEGGHKAMTMALAGDTEGAMRLFNSQGRDRVDNVQTGVAINPAMIDPYTGKARQDRYVDVYRQGKVQRIWESEYTGKRREWADLFGKYSAAEEANDLRAQVAAAKAASGSGAGVQAPTYPPFRPHTVDDRAAWIEHIQQLMGGTPEFADNVYRKVHAIAVRNNVDFGTAFNANVDQARTPAAAGAGKASKQNNPLIPSGRTIDGRVDVTKRRPGVATIAEDTYDDWVREPQRGLDRLRSGSWMYRNRKTGEVIGESEFNERTK